MPAQGRGGSDPPFHALATLPSICRLSAGGARSRTRRGSDAVAGSCCTLTWPSKITSQSPSTGTTITAWPSMPWYCSPSCGAVRPPWETCKGEGTCVHVCVSPMPEPMLHLGCSSLFPAQQASQKERAKALAAADPSKTAKSIHLEIASGAVNREDGPVRLADGSLAVISQSAVSTAVRSVRRQVASFLAAPYCCARCSFGLAPRGRRPGRTCSKSWMGCWMRRAPGPPTSTRLRFSWRDRRGPSSS